MPEKKAPRLLQRLHEEGVAEATIIGEVTAEPKGKIVINKTTGGDFCSYSW